jgi:hypothetical protein
MISIAFKNLSRPKLLVARSFLKGGKQGKKESP